jgi:outer membrane protein OmpA-like peptidoglycan-associated protein
MAASPGSARAQSAGLALNRFDPAPAGDRMFGVESPFVAGKLTPHVMLLGDYAHNPLVLRTTQSDTKLGAVVGSQFFLHLNGGLALWDRVYLHLDVPVALAQSGDSPSGGSAGSYASPSKAQFGDLRVGARVRLLGEYDDPIQVAISGKLWLPTGPSGSYVGTGAVRGLPSLVLGGRVIDRLVWSAAAGPEIEGTTTYAGVQQGTMFNWGAGIGVLLLDNRHLQVGAEASGELTLKDVQKRTTNAEILFDARYRVIDDIEIGAGLGPGLSSGIGTPDFRLVAMAAYTPEVKIVHDKDHDGIPDEKDACPMVAGVKNEDPKRNGCPPGSDRDKDGIWDEDDACPDQPGPKSDDPKKNGCPVHTDRDKDGIWDEDDACPDVPGVASTDPKKHGCPLPPDRDKDGILDADDACPDVPGVASNDPKKHGCPIVDTDGDGIFDDKDACPNEKGVADPDPAKNGCPKAVRVADNEIYILEQVQFDTAKATIKPVSDPLLDEVAGVLKEHKEITKVEVQGHTDNRGSKAGNKQLSQARADSVLKALVKRGIDKGRLSAKGYGQDVPIASNDDDAGRQKNRRVQFKILEKNGQAMPAGDKSADAKAGDAKAGDAKKPADKKPTDAKPVEKKPADKKPTQKPKGAK